MPRPTFEIKVSDDGNEVRLTRTGPFGPVLAAKINRRLNEYEARLVFDVAHGGWYLRSGEFRSALDTGIEPTATLVLTRTK